MFFLKAKTKYNTMFVSWKLSFFGFPKPKLVVDSIQILSIRKSSHSKAQREKTGVFDHVDYISTRHV